MHDGTRQLFLKLLFPLSFHINFSALFLQLDDSAPLVCQPNSKGPWFVFGVGSQTSPNKRNPCPSNFTSVVPMLSWIRGVVPKKDLSLFERNTTVPTPSYNETLTSPKTTLGPQSSNTTYRESDVPTKDVHNFTTTSTQSPCLEPNHGSGINCTGHTTVPPQIQNSTLSSSATTQNTGSTGNTTASGVDSLWRSWWLVDVLLTAFFICHYC